MNTESTKITYAKVIEDVSVLRDCSAAMGTIFDEFEASMNSVGASDVFLGDASETLGEVFIKLKTKFDSYKNKIIEFSDLISTSEENTARTEQQLKKEAENLRVN